MPTLSISDFAGKSAEYFRQVQETGEALILTESGKPVLQMHGGPADRIIVATAQALVARLVTKDVKIIASKLVVSVW